MMMGIPFGKRCNLWITFENKDSSTIMLLMQPKNNIIIEKYKLAGVQDFRWQYGTLFYGTYIDSTTVPTFVIEDIIKYKGVDVNRRTIADRLAFILEFMEGGGGGHTHQKLQIRVAQIAPTNEEFRYKTYMTKAITGGNTQSAKKCRTPQYKLPTVFKMKARNQEDIYELYAYGMDRTPTFYAIAGLNDFKMSMVLKQLFHRFKPLNPMVASAFPECIEMVDDDDDELSPPIFDTQKEIFVECRFNQRFNKWFPVKIIDNHKTPPPQYVSVTKL